VKIGVEQSKNIGFCFFEVAKANPDFPAVISEQSRVSYWQLWQLVESFALAMKKKGVGQGSLVALNTTDMLVSLASLLATSLLGAEFVVAGKQLANTRDLSPTHFFRSSEVSGSAAVKFDLIGRSWLPKPESKPVSPSDTFEGYRDSEQPWLNLHTSGSTGVPKYLNLSQRIVFDRTEAIKPDFPTQETVMATVFPFTSRPFYARAIGALLNTCTIVDSYSLQAWTSLGVNLVCGSPSQLLKVFSNVNQKPKIERLEVSGDKLSDADAKTFFKSFETVIDIYGASETNKTFANIISLNEYGAIVATGKPLDTSIEIVDDAGKPCPAGSSGTVRVQNGYMISGYLHSNRQSDPAFRDGWFYPGDIGTWGPRGELQILGRQDEILNLGGIKINAALVDSLICSVEGVKDAACFKNPKTDGPAEILAFAVLDKDYDRQSVLDEALELCKSKLGVVLAPRRIRVIDQIPKSAGGSPQRDACQKILLDHIGQAPKPV